MSGAAAAAAAHAAQHQLQSASPNDHHNIDPAMGGAPLLPPETLDHEGSPEESADGRKIYGKRALSTSKRAAQNRAAQVSYQCAFETCSFAHASVARVPSA